MRHRGGEPPVTERGNEDGAADSEVMPLVGLNVVVPDDGYYAWQLATIVARLHELRRKRRARYRLAAS